MNCAAAARGVSRPFLSFVGFILGIGLFDVEDYDIGDLILTSEGFLQTEACP